MAVALAALLSGCAGLLPKAVLRHATAEDLQAAVQIANEAGDRVGADCYDAMLNHLPKPLVTNSVGPVSAYAAARVRVRALKDGIPEEVHVKCAPLIVDAEKTLTGLGLFLK